jgi:hypothetical protein
VVEPPSPEIAEEGDAGRERESLSDTSADDLEDDEEMGNDECIIAKAIK